MDTFRKKQKAVYAFFYVMVTLTLCFMLIAPLFGNWYRANGTTFTDISLVMIFITIAATYFYSRYRKAKRYIDELYLEINDCGYYYTDMHIDDTSQYAVEVYNNFGKDFYTVNSDVRLDGRFFEFTANKQKKSIYLAKCKKLSREDFFEFSDAVNASVSASNVRQKRTVALVVLCEKLDDEVLKYSKIITQLGKIRVVPMIVNVADKKAYFLNDKTDSMSFIYKNVLNYSDGEIPDSKMSRERLEYQKELEKNMESFNLKDFRHERFNPRA